MKRAAVAVRRFLVRNLTVLTIILIAAGWERITQTPITLRTTVSLLGGWFILTLLWKLACRLVKVWRNSIIDAAISETEKPQRVFVEDPANVLALAKHTGYDALRRFTPYLGKWVRLSGSFDGIAESLRHDAIHLSLLLPDNTRINLRFAIDHREQLLRLADRRQITVIGRIELDYFTFMPDRCELIRVRPVQRVEPFTIAIAS